MNYYELLFFGFEVILISSIAKQENVRFYTEKCGFQIASTERDGNVELVRFLLERLLE